MAVEKVIEDIIGTYSPEIIEKAKNMLIQQGDKDQQEMETVTDGVDIYSMCDGNARRYICELGLDSPEKLAVFVVEISFAAIETIIDSSNEIKRELLNERVAQLEGLKERIKHAFGTEKCQEKLEDYQDDLIDLRNILQRKFSDKVAQIRQVDAMNPIARKLKSAFILSKVDEATSSARVCLEAILEVQRIQSYIASYIGDQNYHVIESASRRFMEETVFPDIQLMGDWATKEQRSFWSEQIEQEFHETLNNGKKLLEHFSATRTCVQE